MLHSWMLSFALLAESGFVPGQDSPAPREQRFFEWTRMPFSKEVYRARRKKMLAGLRRTGGGVFLSPARHGVSDGFTFRRLDDFLYFTGLELPDSMLVLDADAGKVILFSPPRDARYENPSRPNDFPGRTLGADLDLAEASGIAGVRPFSDLLRAVEGWVTEGRRLRLNFDPPGSIPRVPSDFIASWTPAETLTFHLQRDYPRVRIDNAYDDVARLRMVHGPEEIAAMRRVCDLTSAAIRHAAGFVRGGMASVDGRRTESGAMPSWAAGPNVVPCKDHV